MNEDEQSMLDNDPEYAAWLERTHCDASYDADAVAYGEG